MGRLLDAITSGKAVIRIAVAGARGLRIIRGDERRKSD
jgi:hypothetical protein